MVVRSYDDLDVWCCFCCWLIASKCLELCDANVIMASRGNRNPLFFYTVRFASLLQKSASHWIRNPC